MEENNTLVDKTENKKHSFVKFDVKLTINNKEHTFHEYECSNCRFKTSFLSKEPEYRTSDDQETLVIKVSKYNPLAGILGKDREFVMSDFVYCKL